MAGKDYWEYKYLQSDLSDMYTMFKNLNEAAQEKWELAWVVDRKKTLIFILKRPCY